MKVEQGKGALYNTDNDKGVHPFSLEITEMKNITL